MGTVDASSNRSESPWAPAAGLNPLTILKVVARIDCARGCPYCYNRRFGQVDALAFAPSQAQLRTLDRVLTLDTPSEVEIIGGEPLATGALPTTLAVLQRCSSVRPAPRRLLNTAITAPSAWAEVAGQLDHAYLSLDPVASTRNRKVIHASDLSTLTAFLAEQSVTLTVAAVLDGTETIPTLEAFIAALRRAGITRVGFGIETGAARPPHIIENLSRMIAYLFGQRVEGCGIELGGDLLDAVDQYFSRRARPDYCVCGVSERLLEPSGRLTSGTCVDYRPDFHDLIPHDVGLFAVLKARRRQVLARSDSCRSCPAWPVCHGGCPWEAVRQTGQAMARDIVRCSVLLGVLRTLEGYLPRDLRRLGNRPGAS